MVETAVERIPMDSQLGSNSSNPLEQVAAIGRVFDILVEEYGILDELVVSDRSSAAAGNSAESVVGCAQEDGSNEGALDSTAIPTGSAGCPC